MVAIGEQVTWTQLVVVRAGDQAREVTPTSGKMRVWYVDASGNRQYLDASGNTWGATPVDNPTTIVGNVSRLQHDAPNVPDVTLVCEPWINDDLNTRRDTMREPVEAPPPLVSRTIRRIGT